MTDDTRTTWGQLDTVTGSMTGGFGALDPHLPGLTVLCHPDPSRIGERALLGLSSAGQLARISRLEPLFAPLGGDRRRALMDPRLSRRPLEIVADEGGGVTLRATSPSLRISVDDEPLDAERRCSGAELARGIVLLLSDRITLLLHPMEVLPAAVPSFGLVGQSLGIQAVRRQIARLSDLHVACLVRGESGTGKELVASALHRSSPRNQGPFEAVNMGALPPDLAASALFGAEKGAFTGADRKRQGLFSQADGGTLLLDEIGETPPEVQVLLLRALETGSIRPVGAESETSVDVRLVAATDADLEAAIEEGRFRAPLLHRLSGYEIHLPPLRERLDDLGILLVHFLRQELEAIGEPHRLRDPEPRPWLPAPLVARLTLFDWPGNVRQLRNVARQLVIANRGEAQLRFPPALEAKWVPRGPVSDPSAPAPSGDSGPVDGIPAAGAEPISPPADAPRVVIEALLGCSITDGDAGPEPGLRRRAAGRLRALLPEYGGRLLAPGSEPAPAAGPPLGLFVFERPVEAVGFALEAQETLAELGETVVTPLDCRIGIHLAEVHVPAPTPAIPAPAVPAPAVPAPDPLPSISAEMLSRARALVGLALPGQTLLDRGVFDLARDSARGDHPLKDPSIRWLEHGAYTLDVLDGAWKVEVAEIGLVDEAPLGPPPRVAGQGAKDGKKARPDYRSPDEVSEEEILEALRAHAFKIQPTAAALGISRTSLYTLIDCSGRIRKARDLDREQIEAAAERHDHDLDAMAADLEVSRKGLSRRMTQLGMKR